MYKLVISKAAGKFIKSLAPKQYKQIVSRVLSLRENPRPTDSKKLKGNNPFHRADIGEYRIIYRDDESTVYITIIGKRNDDQIYKKFKQKHN
ncbi:MAG: type II toxin-antitoxin system RelE family toxin [Bacteroidota bacterium]